MDDDPAGAHAALGCITALKGDVGGVEYHHRVARQLDPNHPYNEYNHAISLHILEESPRALQVVIDGLASSPDDLGLLRLGIELAVKSGHVAKASSLLEHWRLVVPDQPHEFTSIVSLMSAAVERGDFDERSLQEVAEMMTELQRSTGVGRTVRWAIWRNYIDESFVYSRKIWVSPRRSADLNEALADGLAERADLMDDLGTKLVAMFTGGSQ